MKHSSPIIFIILCLSWGSTWLAIRLGVATIPPLWFAATRFIAAGLILCLFSYLTGKWIAIKRNEIVPLVLMSGGAISVCFGLIFWAEQYLDSGVSGAVVHGLVPVGLFAFTALMRHQKIRRIQWAAVALSIVGIPFIVGNVSVTGDSSRTVYAFAAIIIGTLVYCWAGVYGGPLLERFSSIQLSGLENLIGGALLIPASLMLEHEQLAKNLFPSSGEAWASWFWLVLVGSIIGFTAYTYVLSYWGPVRASSYALVTPVLSIILASIVEHAPITKSKLIGTALLLLAILGVLGSRWNAHPGFKAAQKPETD